MNSWEVLLLFQMAQGKVLAKRQPTDYDWRIWWLLANLDVTSGLVDTAVDTGKS